LPDGLFSNQKIPILVKFGGPWNGKCYYILWPFGILYGHLVQFMALYSLWSFGTFFRFWYVWTGKNLATLSQSNKMHWNISPKCARFADQTFGFFATSLFIDQQTLLCCISVDERASVTIPFYTFMSTNTVTALITTLLAWHLQK
jgi:hypothetical protein